MHPLTMRSRTHGDPKYIRHPSMSMVDRFLWP
ncbi:hypothetical protein CJF32_00004172 [Rutstroemia sp. NJR-2017a WRK4]|nr:hypothetical protein CJF32_00004172 [Rutstroemia sp. NJR-2017a WRK4]